MRQPGSETRKTRFFRPKTPQYLGKKRAGRRDQIGLSSHQRNDVYFIAHTTGLLKQRNRNVAWLPPTHTMFSMIHSTYCDDTCYHLHMARHGPHQTTR